jgi:hypothetical protein
MRMPITKITLRRVFAQTCVRLRRKFANTDIYRLSHYFLCLCKESSRKHSRPEASGLMPSISSIEHFLGQSRLPSGRQWGIELHRAL